MKHLPRQLWNTNYPRYEVIPTRDVFLDVRRMLGYAPDVDICILCRQLLSTTFDIWAIENRFKDPYMPHYPPMYEPCVKMSGHPVPTFYDRVMDSVVWPDIDLVRIFTDNGVKDEEFRSIINRVVQRLESMYPPTGYDGLQSISLNVHDWAMEDMVVYVH